MFVDINGGIYGTIDMRSLICLIIYNNNNCYGIIQYLNIPLGNTVSRISGLIGEIQVNSSTKTCVLKRKETRQEIKHKHSLFY